MSRGTLAQAAVLGAGGGVTLIPTTWDPAYKHASISLSNGNLTATDTNTVSFNLVRSVVGVSSGKWYWELTLGTTNTPQGVMVGVMNGSQVTNNYVGSSANSWGYVDNGDKENGAGASAYGASFATGNNIGIALDMDAGTITCYKNGVSQGVMYSGLSGTIYAGWSCIWSGNSVTANFGASPFSYSVPAGFNPGLGTI